MTISRWAWKQPPFKKSVQPGMGTTNGPQCATWPAAHGRESWEQMSRQGDGLQAE